MKNIDKLAQMFKDRENKTLITVTMGEVISRNPLRINYGDRIILERKQLVIGSRVGTLYAGEKVILIPDNALKKWYVIDKVVTS